MSAGDLYQATYVQKTHNLWTIEFQGEFQLLNKTEFLKLLPLCPINFYIRWDIQEAISRNRNMTKPDLPSFAKIVKKTLFFNTGLFSFINRIPLYMHAGKHPTPIGCYCFYCSRTHSSTFWYCISDQ